MPSTEGLQLQPIGSVVAVGVRRFVVVGHRLTRDGEVMGPGYVLVPYPLGFVDVESLTVAPVHAVDEVVCAGYADEATTAYLSGFAEVAKTCAGLPYSEYTESVRLLHDFVQEEVHHG